ncbi:MAG: type II secretion system protein [Candidatus Microsaccharimonas sp.]
MLVKNNTTQDKKQAGFTIVELLIVIVVIAILAAITIVAYNGISSRAKVSAMITDLSSVSKSLANGQILNPGNYPDTASQAGFVDKAGVTYEYAIDNNASPKYFCATATTGGTSYFVSNLQINAKAGTCADHGDPATITNLIKDPSLTVLPTASFGVTGVTGTPSIQTNATAHSGSTYLRYTISSGTSSTMTYTLSSSSISSSLVANTPYTMSFKVRPSKAMNFNSDFSWTDGSGNTQYSSTSSISAPINTWTTVSVTGQSATPVTVKMELATASGSNWANGNYLDVDSLMVTQGSIVYDYRDGASGGGWAWNGTTNNSSSTGPRP